VRRSPRRNGRKRAEAKKSKEAAPTSTKGRNSGQAKKSKQSARKTNERDKSVTTEQSSSEEEGSTDNVDDEDDEDSESEYSRENDYESSETSKASVAIDEVPVPGEVAVVQQKLPSFQPIQCSNAFVQKSDRVDPPFTPRECNVLAEVLADEVFCNLTHTETRRVATQFISKTLNPSPNVEPTAEEQINFGLFLETVNLYVQHKVESANSKFILTLFPFPAPIQLQFIIKSHSVS
jgi:hypothetical protein